MAHLLADQLGLRLLSVDSMMVYRHLDIGTAKPTSEEQERYAYAGVNLVDPGQRFSTGHWLRAIREQLDDRPTLAVGGTGLYFKALMLGLDEDTRQDRGETPDVAFMQRELERLKPGILSSLADPENPRRLERALLRIQEGKDLPGRWIGDRGVMMPVLHWPPHELNERIESRIRMMFEQGLLAEVSALQQMGALTGTASQAIGYQEAEAVLEGTASREEAIQALATRTRRYAKRQRTWFRNQMNSRWIEVRNDQDRNRLADEVRGVWEETGPFLFSRETGD